MSFSPSFSLEATFRRFSAPLVIASGLVLAGCGTSRYIVNADSCETSTTTDFRLGETPVGVISTGQVLANSRVDHGFSKACDTAMRAVRTGMQKDHDTGNHLSSALQFLITFYNQAEAEVKRHVEARLARFHQIGISQLPALELAVRKAELKAGGHNTEFDCRNYEKGARLCRFRKEEELKIQDPLTGAPAATAAPPAPTPAGS